MVRKNKLKNIIACYDDYTFVYEVKNGQLGPASNLTDDNIKTIFKSTLADVKVSFMKFKSLIPSNVLHFDPIESTIIFYTEPAMKKLLFKTNSDIKSGEYKVPFLLWVYKNKKLNLYALKKKPTSENDKVYQAPFMNIDNSGNVCMGSARYKNDKDTFDDLMENIVSIFFNSYFTHTNTDQLLKMNYQLFLKENMGNKNFSFSQYLVETKHKIKDLI